MYQEIDFLPASYHEQRHLKRKQHWRRAIGAVCVVLMLLGGAGQVRKQSQLSQKRDELRRQADGMLAQLDDPEQLRKTIDGLRVRADLRTALALQPRSSQLLSRVIQELPAFVSLTSFSQTSERPAGARQRMVLSGTEENVPPHEADFAKMSEERSSERIVITLNGIAPDDVAVSSFLSRLGRCGLFDDVDLVFTDQHLEQEHQLRSFGIRLTVRRLRPFDNLESIAQRSSKGAAQ